METNNLKALTPAQRQVFEFIAWGETYKEIAARLNRSVYTIINQARGGCERLGIYPSQIPSWWFCAKFDISFDTSPVKRKIGAFMLLVLLSTQMMDHNVVRRFRPRVRRGRIECVLDYNEL